MVRLTTLSLQHRPALSSSSSIPQFSPNQLGASAVLAPVCPHLSGPGVPKNKTLETWCQIEGKSPFLEPNVTRILLSFHAAKAQCWVMYLLSNKILVLFCFLDSHLQPVLLYRLFHPFRWYLASTFAKHTNQMTSSACWGPSEQQPCPLPPLLLPQLDIICSWAFVPSYCPNC